MSRLEVGQKIPSVSLTTIHGKSVQIPAPDSPLVHIQFRRFAGCPICNLHLRTMKKRRAELESAGIREIIFFHSKQEDMLPYQGELPFDCIADADKSYYRKFGVETSLLGVIDPRNLKSLLQGMLQDRPQGAAFGKEQGSLGMPADFLVNEQGRIIALKYGTYADDQWSVDELLAMAQAHK